MIILGTLSRSVGWVALRCLCSRYGTAVILTGNLTLASGMAFYLHQHPGQVAARTPVVYRGSVLVPAPQMLQWEEVTTHRVQLVSLPARICIGVACTEAKVLNSAP
jgi:hypothetical protein